MSNVFDERSEGYDAWFDKYPWAYRSELAALKRVVSGGLGLEVGVGTGRFAAPLGVKVGLDPSIPMLSIARGRGIEVVRGVAAHLPFRNDTFDLVLFMTTLCYVGDTLRALMEAKRVVNSHGRIAIGFIDKGSTIGREYATRAKASPFYGDARFYSTEELKEILHEVGCAQSAIFQTVFRDPKGMTAPDPVIEGHGKGLFVVISARR